MCLPEAYDNLFEDTYYGAHSDPDYGYKQVAGRHKVTLWSKSPWSNVDQFGSNKIPSGRYVRARTQTERGVVDVIGICIPWSHAHVSTGRRDAKVWDEHGAFLRGLPELLSSVQSDKRILLGDFNQSLPSKRVPSELASQLQHALTNFEVWTTGTVSDLQDQLVCHIASSGLPNPTNRFGVQKQVEGTRVSDHDGVVVDF